MYVYILFKFFNEYIGNKMYRFIEMYNIKIL